MLFPVCISAGTSAWNKEEHWVWPSLLSLSLSCMSLSLLVIPNLPVLYPKAGGGFDYATRALGKRLGIYCRHGAEY